MKRAAAFGLIIASLSLAGCTSGPPADHIVGPVSEYHPREPMRIMDCSGSDILPAALIDPQPATELNPETVADIEASGRLGQPIVDWSVATSGERFVMLWRELGPEEPAGPLDYDHTFVRFEQPSDSSAWVATSSGSCTLLRDVGELHHGTVTLDPNHLPDPSDTTLHLLVTERACASGRDADGRVEVVEVNNFVSVVELVVAVRPITDAVAFCPGNPPTPFEVELDYPLGERTIMDGAREPALEVALP